MPAFDALLKRFGFVKLSRYGLVLTSEGRIMSLRPAILDDGLGGRIVGWRDGDLAAMELQKWEPARPAAKPGVATRLAVTPPPRPMPKPALVVAPAAPVAVPPLPQVAQAPQVEEDDWEWEIAYARARVAAEEQATAQARAPRARLDTIPPPQPKLAVVTIPPRAPTQPIATIDYEDRTSPSSEIVRITNRPAVAAERPQAAPVGVRKTTLAMPVATIPPKQERPGTTPPTIIPVPKLPSIKDRQLQIQPVVSSAPRPSRTRFAKGTGPIAGTQVGVAPPPPMRAAEDNTSPSMPAAAAPVSLPSIKRFVR